MMFREYRKVFGSWELNLGSASSYEEETKKKGLGGEIATNEIVGGNSGGKFRYGLTRERVQSREKQ